jgi:hypothetical protein
MATTYSAYSVYWYDTSVTPVVGHGMAGRIRDTGSTVRAIPNLRTLYLNGDPKVEGFIDTASNLRIAVTDREADAYRPVYIYDAASTAGTLISTQTWPEENLYTLTRLGNFLYGIDYDTATVFEVNASAPYAATGITYPLASSFFHAGFTARGQALTVVDDVLYGLYAFPDSTFANYAPSLIVRFDVVGGTSIAVAESNPNIEKNAFSFADNDGEIFIASIGGRQYNNFPSYNTNSKIQSVDCPAVSTGLTTRMSNADLPYEYRGISFRNGTAYVLAGAYDSSWQLKGKLVSTTDFTNLTNIDDFSTAAIYGYYWSAQYTPDNDRLWYTRGNDVRVYDAANLPTIVGTLPMSTLKGSGAYTDLNDLTYVGKLGTFKLSGYRSHIHRSRSKFAQAARALTKGRPELTEEEFTQLVAIHGAP